MQERLKEGKTNDEKIQEILVKSIDEQLAHFVKQIESLERNIHDFKMQISNLNFRRRRIIEEGWKNALPNTTDSTES